jgi:hypothetical protein
MNSSTVALSTFVEKSWRNMAAESKNWGFVMTKYWNIKGGKCLALAFYSSSFAYGIWAVLKVSASLLSLIELNQETAQFVPIQAMQQFPQFWFPVGR